MGEYAVGVATRTRIYRVCKELFYRKGIKPPRTTTSARRPR
ncbi:hypothetical protein [Eggerthella sinensis]|nr:hypothetical protein [Eggerthella sinensis]